MNIVPMTEWWHLEHSLQMAWQALPPAAVTSFVDLRAELCHKDAQYFVALINGGVKGFAGLKKTGLNRRVFEFPWCVVHPEYRNQGIGRMLTTRRIEEVKERGGSAVLLSTPLPDLYAKFGFHTLGTLPGWADHLMFLSLDTDARIIVRPFT